MIAGRWLLLIFFVALAVRIAQAAGRAGEPWLLDEASYVAAAQRLAATGFALPTTGVSGPLFPALLAAAIHWFGPDPLIPRLVVAATGALVAPIAALIAAGLRPPPAPQLWGEPDGGGGGSGVRPPLAPQGWGEPVREGSDVGQSMTPAADDRPAAGIAAETPPQNGGGRGRPSSARPSSAPPPALGGAGGGPTPPPPSPSPLLTGLAVAVWPPLVFWQGLVMTEALASLILVAVTWLVLELPAGRGWRVWLAGALIGVSSLARPNLLIWLPVGVGWLLVRAPKRQVGYRAAAGFLVAYALVLLPWWHRQFEIQGAFVPATVKTGDVLLGANNPSTYSGPDAFGWIDPVGRPGWWEAGDEARTEVERDRRRTAAAIDFARTHADRLPAVAAWRSLDYWQIHLGQQREDLPANPQASPWFQGLHLLALALAATTLLTRSGTDGRIALIGAIVLGGWLTGVVFWGGGGRFRAPSDPLILVLAAIALGDFGRSLGRRRKRAR